MKQADFRNVAAVLPQQAALDPNGVAIIFDGQRFSYAALDRLSARIAARLVAAGVAQGDRVALLARNSERFIAALFGIVRAGAVATPINWRLAPPEIAAIVVDAGPKLVFTDDRCATLLTAAGVALDAVDLDQDALATWLDATPADSPAPDAATGPDDVVLQIYTSGTTGLPKGAMLANRNFEKFAGLETDRYPAWWGLGPGDVSLIALPLFHVGGIEAIVRVLFSGATMILHREFDPAEVLASIATYRPTIVSLVPTALQMVLNHPTAATTDFSCIRTMIYGASPITLGLLRQAIAAMPAQFVQVYGMTEACSSIVALPPEIHHPDGTPQMRAAGRALPGVELKIVREDGGECAPCEVGEVMVRGATVMAGYWNNPIATAAAVGADGWLRSGDAGYLDAEGYLYIHDRVKDMIISGAENIYPTEVEDAIFGHPAVAEVAVIGAPDEKWGESVLAIVVPKAGARVDEDDVIAWARARIAAYKAPRRVMTVDELPKNGAGKLLKTDLRKRFADVFAA